MPLMTLNDLLKDEVRDLYNAEQQIVQALPKMISGSSAPELRETFQHHLDQTHFQIDRLKKVMGHLGVTADGKTCRGMAGIIEEGEEFLDEQGEPAVLDAALISAAQRVEHYEISAYGSVCTYARTLGLDEVEDLLGQNLKEEKKTDEKLTKLATGGMFRSGFNKEAREGH